MRRLKPIYVWRSLSNTQTSTLVLVTQFEERHSFFTVGVSTSIPIFNRNQGPIAEAEARRKESAAAFLQTQAQVIARSERALAVYHSAEGSG